MLGVVTHLDGAPTVRLVDGCLHSRGNPVTVENSLAVYMPCRTSHRLRQAALVAQETCLVGIKDGYETHLRQVQSLTQQVDAHQHVVLASAQVFHNLDAFDGVDVRVYIGGLDAVPPQVLVQLLRHAFGQGGDKDAFVAVDACLDVIHQVIHLVLRRADFYLRVEQSCGTDELVDDDTLRAVEFVLVRRGGDVDGLSGLRLELVELERAVVACRRQTETVSDEVVLAGFVAAVHAAYLRYGHMAFVDDEQHVFGEIVEQAVRRCAFFAPVEITAVVLHAGAVA